MHSRPLNPHRSAQLAARGRRLLAEATISERALWSALAGSRLGVAFRRQVVLGEMIVDFLAPSLRLIVEVDGGYHAERAKADARRDARLEALGYRVLHIDAALVMRDLEGAVVLVRAALRR